MSCYALLSGCLLPWPPPCCQDETTPFLVSDEHPLRHLSMAFGSSRVAGPAYREWPTNCSMILSPRFWLGNREVSANSKFESQLRARSSQDCHSLALYDLTLLRATAALGCISEETSYNDGSIGLSPLYSHSTIDLHVRTVIEPPPGFPLASPYASIVHHLSGLSRHALTRSFHQPLRAAPGRPVLRAAAPLAEVHTTFTRCRFNYALRFESPSHLHAC